MLDRCVSGDRLGSLCVAAAGLGGAVVAAALTASGSSSEYVELEALARAVMVATPIAVGLYARRHAASARFGMLLIVAGFGWFLATLSESGDEWVYSVGRVAAWLVEVALMYTILAFPTGRLPARVDRVLVGATALVVLLLYLPTALLVESYPVPTPWTDCGAGCPGNAFMIVDSEPAFVDDVVRPLREVLIVGLFAAVTARVAWRMRGASSLTRRALWPVLAVALFRLAAFALTLAGRRIAPDSPLVDVGVWLLALSVPLLAIAFLVGVWRWRLFMAVAMQRLATRLRAHPGPDNLRAALADAFEDPSLELTYRLEDGRWADAAGHEVAAPVATPQRALTEVGDGDRRVAAILHDPVLASEQAFSETAVAYTLMTLDNHRLSAQAASLLREVRESRARIQSSADDERRRIEHDLHDGAQQRLVALRIKLELAAERAGDNGGAAELLRGLGSEVEEAIDEVRSLARGIFPAQLADRGLVEALRSAALRSALPATVLAAGVGRYPRDVESAAYFCCLEALQNAAKHARDATAVVVDLSDNGDLRFEVRDDGAGFDPTAVTGGVGLTSMRDRVAAVGGVVEIESRPGRGTRVSARIPLDGVVLGSGVVDDDRARHEILQRAAAVVDEHGQEAREERQDREPEPDHADQRPTEPERSAVGRGHPQPERAHPRRLSRRHPEDDEVADDERRPGTRGEHRAERVEVGAADQRRDQREQRAAEQDDELGDQDVDPQRDSPRGDPGVRHRR
jgi:signal transduction histidine kinase